MKYAFVHRNFRALSFEKKTIFLANFLTLVLCFFPWFSAEYPPGNIFYYNAFSGPAFLIGYFIFLISLVIFLLFLDRLLDRRKIKLTFPENYLYGVCGLEQVLLLVLAWSVLLSTSKDFMEARIMFGIFVALIAQISALVATFLEMQQDKQQEAKEFFQMPGNDSKQKEDSKQDTLL